MPDTAVYMDNHATTRCDPRVVEAMLPFWTEVYGNAGSVSHSFGAEAKEAAEASRSVIASAINAKPREIVFTSGATESNNLALRGAADRLERKGKHLISVPTEHKAVLDPMNRLTRRGFEVSLLNVQQSGDATPGLLDADQIADAIRDDTIIVSVMLANNEIGVIQPIKEIGEICRDRGVLLHCDATQAVGKIPVDAKELNVDLMSFSAHKLYGPKGIGALYVGRRSPQTRLVPLIDGGGQENGHRSGTLNVPGAVGFAKAVELAVNEIESETPRLLNLRQRLFEGLIQRLADLSLNGPGLERELPRLAGNLNMSFAFVDGEALMMSMGTLAVSSGSACTSANPEPSHVLRSIGLSDDATRSSLRFGLGRFNTTEDVDFAIETVTEAVTRLRKLSSLA